MTNVNFDKLFIKINYEYTIFRKKYNFLKVHKRCCEISCAQYDTNQITWAKAWGNQVLGDKKEK